jgi:gamma-glutamyl:cysteine ligase YbdK (ATP-grasp superfamily)
VSGRAPLRLFEGFGIELEYMIVDRATLAVAPLADALLRAESGEVTSELEQGELAWSNELALHLVELKTNGPVKSLHGVAASFADHVARILARLAPHGATLMPTGMHPWMDPEREFHPWPHEYGPVYAAFHRVFDCRGHGWANLQSVHLNLPFADDDEFGRLHAALRLLLPILPALAASSPLVAGRASGWLDTRLHFYRDHAARVPSVVGDVIPEPLYTRRDYEAGILARIYADVAPLDPEGVLRHEWLNARGAIARFDRSALEVRLLDVQECPRADLAIAAAVAAAARALVEGRFADRAAQERWPTPDLAAILDACVRDADAALVRDAAYLRALGFPGPAPCTARELWAHLVERTLAREPGWDEWAPALTTILREGCLARRILAALAGDLRRERLAEVYRELCRCLAASELFRPGSPKEDG